MPKSERSSRRLRKAAEDGRSDAIVDDDHCSIVALSNLVERSDEGVAAIEEA